MRLTPEQEKHIRNARVRINNEPESYRQRAWGTGKADCRTPACVAGHIVAANPERQQRVLALGRSWLRKEAVEREARAALGLKQSPALFSGAWPKRWLRTAGLYRPGPGWLHPTADEAVAVLDAILAGRISESLDPEIPA